MRSLILSLFTLFLSLPVLADPVMDCINDSGVLRCGYVMYSPAIQKNLQTGELEGFMVDIMAEAGQRLYLDIEWAYEADWPTLAADLATNKFDMACLSYWVNLRAARQMLHSVPLWYQPTFFLTRANDSRFDEDISKINNKDVRVSVLEGDVPETILSQLYPEATRVTLPQNASFAQVFQEVASRRADVTIASLPDVAEFEEHNPGVLKAITSQPARLYQSAMLMRKDAVALKNAIDSVVTEMLLDGTIEKIIKKYATTKDDFYVIQHPYKKLEIEQ